MKAEIRKSSTVAYPGKMIQVYKDTVELENGREAWREVVRHPGASAVILQLDDGRILLEKQYRYPIAQFLLEIPAGKLDKGEDPLQCAQRELKEETGYEATGWLYLGPLATGPGFCDEVIHMYFAKAEKSGSQALDEDEFVETLALTKEEILQKIQQQEIIDAKTIAGMLMAMPYL